jgi:hypothetical protein
MLATIFWAASANADSDEDVDPWADWQVTLNCKTYNHFLDYPTSSIHSLFKVSASYAQPQTRPATAYEDLFYSDDHPVGCQRRLALPITPGTAGTIKVVNATPSQCYALANAILRVYLEIGLKRCMTKAVQVPPDCFDRLVDALCQQGFHVAGSRPNEGQQGWLISIEVDAIGNEDQTKRLFMP